MVNMHLRFLTAALLCGAALAACSKKEEPAKPAPQVSAAAPAARASLGDADYAVGGVKVALLELKRSGTDAVLLRWQYRNESDRDLKIPLGAIGMDPFRFAKDVFLQDASGKKYTVLKDPPYSLQAAKHDEFQLGITLKPRQVANTWAKLEAPPAEVTKVTVLMPGAPPFENVLIGQ